MSVPPLLRTCVCVCVYFAVVLCCWYTGPTGILHMQQLSREMQEKDEEVNEVRCLYHDVIMMSRHDVL